MRGLMSCECSRYQCNTGRNELLSNLENACYDTTHGGRMKLSDVMTYGRTINCTENRYLYIIEIWFIYGQTYDTGCESLIWQERGNRCWRLAQFGSWRSTWLLLSWISGVLLVWCPTHEATLFGLLAQIQWHRTWKWPRAAHTTAHRRPHPLEQSQNAALHGKSVKPRIGNRIEVCWGYLVAWASMCGGSCELVKSGRKQSGDDPILLVHSSIGTL